MPDVAKLRLYYEDLSDDDLADAVAEGAEAYVPETWIVIGDEFAKRRREMRQTPVVIPEDADPEPDRPPPTARARLQIGVNTAYATAAYFALRVVLGPFMHAQLRWIVFNLVCSVFYVAVAVRMKRRMSVRAAALGLACALGFVLVEGYLVLVRRFWTYHFSRVVIFSLIVYALVEALWATQSLRAQLHEETDSEEVIASS